MRVDFVS